MTANRQASGGGASAAVQPVILFGVVYHCSFFSCSGCISRISSSQCLCFPSPPSPPLMALSLSLLTVQFQSLFIIAIAIIIICAMSHYIWQCSVTGSSHSSFLFIDSSTSNMLSIRHKLYKLGRGIGDNRNEKRGGEEREQQSLVMAVASVDHHHHRRSADVFLFFSSQPV